MNVVFFEWDDGYSVKVPSIDRQHKVLIDYINKLQVVITCPKQHRHMIELILNGLVNYTNSHFRYEEMLIGMHRYPDAEQHKSVRAGLFGRVAVFKQRFENSDPDVGEELLGFPKTGSTNIPWSETWHIPAAWLQ